MIIKHWGHIQSGNNIFMVEHTLMLMTGAYPSVEKAQDFYSGLEVNMPVKAAMMARYAKHYRPGAITALAETALVELFTHFDSAVGWSENYEESVETLHTYYPQIHLAYLKKKNGEQPVEDESPVKRAYKKPMIKDDLGNLIDLFQAAVRADFTLTLKPEHMKLLLERLV